jgi:hypothetical protein
MDKLASVFLMGGLGNQLFQLSFANKLRQNGLKVYIDTSNYDISSGDKDLIKKREIVIPVDNFDFQKCPDAINYLLKFNNLLLNNTFKNYRFLPISKFNDFNLTEDYKFINQFVGYWQSVSLIEESKEFLLNGLSKVDKVNTNLSKPEINGSTAVHVRRGDYLKMSEALSINYFEDAIKKGRSSIDKFKFDIFTDDMNWVLENDIFKDAENIFEANDSIEGTLNSFGKLFTYQNYIISNSTFSIIPAILSSGPEGKVFVPDPWFRNMNRDFKYPKNWVRIKNLEN